MTKTLTEQTQTLLNLKKEIEARENDVKLQEGRYLQMKESMYTEYKCKSIKELKQKIRTTQTQIDKETKHIENEVQRIQQELSTC